jgi:hypothetical protein
MAQAGRDAADQSGPAVGKTKDDKGRSSYAARTSYDELARRAGLNRRNVGRAVKRLEGRGLVKVVHRGGLRRGVSGCRVRGRPKDG